MKGKLVVGVKEVESECCFWSTERCRVPAHTQRLVVGFYPVRSPLTCAELYIQMVGTIHVNNQDLLKGVGRWTRGMLVADVKTEI